MLWVLCLTRVEECCMMIWRMGINSNSNISSGLSSSSSNGLAHHNSSRFSLSITLPSSLNNNNSSISNHAAQVTCLFLPLSSKHMPLHPLHQHCTKRLHHKRVTSSLLPPFSLRIRLLLFCISLRLCPSSSRLRIR